MITRYLECQLNDADVFDREQRLANAEHDYAKVEGEKKDAAADFKRQLDAIGSRIGELSNAIRDKKEMRDVECTIQGNHARMVHEVVRLDTGQIIEAYPFTEAERQGKLV